MESLFFFKQKTAYEMRISDWRFRRVLFRSLRGVALYPAIVRRMVDRNAAFPQHVPKVAIADRIATIPAHRPQDHITMEMAPLEIRHRSVRPISAKHAQASRFLQQSRAQYHSNRCRHQHDHPWFPGWSRRRQRKCLHFLARYRASSAWRGLARRRHIFRRYSVAVLRFQYSDL